MANLTRWDPFREMMTFRSMFDRIFDSALDQRWSGQQEVWGLPLDVAEKDDEFVVKASLPGVHPDDLNITYSNNVLTISGELKEDKDVDEDKYHLRERWTGSFTRSISLPATVKGDKIEAEYESGVLTLRLPKAEEARPKRITVKSGAGQKMIEGQSRDIRHHN